MLPVVVLEDADKAVPLGEALLSGGIDLVEITFRTAAAAECIRRIRAAFPEMLTGAGTILNPAQAAEAVQAGAEFMVSPGLSPELAEYSRKSGIPLIPGVATASEIMLAQNLGLETVKFFPAEACGGTEMLKSWHGPFASVKFLPTGGIKASNMLKYLELPYVAAIGGSWMIPASALKENDYETVTALCREAVSLRKEIRP